MGSRVSLPTSGASGMGQQAGLEQPLYCIGKPTSFCDFGKRQTGTSLQIDVI